jgi:AAA family ATP:ADP antiporter
MLRLIIINFSYSFKFSTLSFVNNYFKRMSSMSHPKQEFSKLRGIFFPIYRQELKKFLPMGLMMFFILFNYYILRDTKDTLIVHAAGAEALSLIKLLGTVPGAILILLLYSKLSNIFNRENLFYITLLPFIIFFGLFAFVIYPYRAFLHPSADAVQELILDYPRFKTLLHVYGSWSYGVFYVLAELWGSVILSLLFWQFANEIVKIHEAKRFYTLFGMLANVGLIAAGSAVTYFSHIREQLSPGIDPWGLTLNYLMCAVVLAGLMTMGIFWWMNRNVLTDPQCYQPEQTGVSKTKKPKLSLKESFFYLIRSKHLGYLALVVICYGVSQNVIEAVWKDQIKRVFSTENAYNAFMGQFTVMTGLVTILFMLIGSNIVRLFGWLPSAMLTPLMILGTGLLFFGFVSYKQEFESYTLAWLGMTPTLLAVWLGFSQNILSKATKYSLFDPTKEMCYIPLDQESKIKGKAAVDVVGGRIGKSGGSFIQQTLLFVLGSTLVELAPILGGVVIVTVIIWIIANRSLNRSLQSLQEAPSLSSQSSKQVVLSS